MAPRIALGIWIGVSLFLFIAALTLRLFKASSNSQFDRHVVAALLWPFMLFSARGREALIAIFKDTQKEKS